MSNKQALLDLLEDHPAGPLLMKHCHVAKVGTPVDFIGYRVRLRWKLYGGGTRLTPSAEAFSRFADNLERRLRKGSLKNLEAVASQYTQRWSDSYPSWDRSSAGDDLLWLSALEVIQYVRSQKMKTEKLGIYAHEGSNSFVWMNKVVCYAHTSLYPTS